jgi:hypothetical protein
MFPNERACAEYLSRLRWPDGFVCPTCSANLNEYVFRFNRRFYPMAAFNSVLGIAVRVEAPTYDGLYDGTWPHPQALTGTG